MCVCVRVCLCAHLCACSNLGSSWRGQRLHGNRVDRCHSEHHRCDGDSGGTPRWSRRSGPPHSRSRCRGNHTACTLLPLPEGCRRNHSHTWNRTREEMRGGEGREEERRGGEEERRGERRGREAEGGGICRSMTSSLVPTVLHHVCYVMHAMLCITWPQWGY